MPCRRRHQRRRHCDYLAITKSEMMMPLSPADLLHININDKNIAKGNAVVAVGVYHNKKIKPQYKYIKSYSPNGKFELKTNYLGFEIVSRN